jgi:hypothetical protein
MADFSLGLYSSAFDGEAEIMTLTNTAQSWTRSIRLQGGYWQGRFSMFGPATTLRDWFYTFIGYHVKEVSGGNVTWEGYISEMDLHDYKDPAEITVRVKGYIHTANWRFVSVSGSAADASDWIASIVSTDCELLSAGRIEENTLQVQQETNIDNRAWDEILRVVELGDDSGNPWRFWCGTGRKVYYKQIPTAPLYYVHGGIVRRRSLDQTYNYVHGVYSDEDNTIQDIDPASNTRSIGKYGRREEEVIDDNIDQTAAEALRDRFLSEHQWPSPRAITGIRNLQIYTDVGRNLAVSPWAVQPGVYRDVQAIVSGRESDAWFLDRRDFLVDEVEVSERGLVIKTKWIEESDLLAAQIRMNQRITDDDESGRGTRPARDLPDVAREFDDLTPRQRRALRRRNK